MTPEELEALRLAQEAEATNPMMQPTDLIGQQGQQETEMDTNPLLMGGLGLGGGFVASQTGGAPATNAQAQPDVLAAAPAVQAPVEMATPASVARLTTLPKDGVYDQFDAGIGQLGAGSPMGNLIEDLPGADVFFNPLAAGMAKVELSRRQRENALRENAQAQPDVSAAAPTVQTPAQVGLSPEERARIETRLARTNADIVASGETVGGAPQEGFVSKLAGRLGEQFTQPAPYTPLLGGAESETAFGATPTQPTLFREGLSAISELNKTPLTSPDSYRTKAPEAIYGDGNLPALSPQSLAEQGTTPALAEQGTPQSLAKQGSPQAIFEGIRAQGPLSPELIAAGQARAEAMGTTFDPETGFSRDPFLQFQQAQQGRVAPSQALSGFAPMGVEETRARLGGRKLNEYLNAPDGTPGVSGLRTDPQGRMIPAGFETRADAYPSYEDFAAEREGRLAARMQQPGESITERDTRIAAERTQSSQNVPTDVREAMLTPEGRRTAKQINRLARWSGSTQGQEMGGVAGLEQSLQPVDAQKQQYDAMRAYKLGLEIDKMQQEKPSEYQESAAEVDEAIAAGSIKPEDRNKFILRDLGWQAKEGEDSSEFMRYVYGDATGSGGEPTLVKTQKEYDNLAKGTRYIDADGNIATKK